MSNWVRTAGGAINRTPVLLIMPLVMFCFWACAAEIYAAALWAHYGSGIAVFGLVGCNVVISWLLVFNILSFAHDLGELLLPKRRQLLAGGLVIVLGLAFVAPCAFVWSVRGGPHDVLVVAMGSVVGSSAALLWRLRSSARGASGARPGTVALGPQVPVQFANPWWAVRVALGPPYAPTPWRKRVIELVALCLILAGAPLLVVLFGDSLRPRVFTIMWRGSQFVGFLLAIGLCWIRPLFRLGAVFNSQSGALNELALLPGLGGGRQQLRRLCLVGLGLPVGGLLVLLIIALSLVAMEHLPNGVYTKLALIFVLIPLFTLPILVGRTANSRAPKGSAMFLIIFQSWTYSLIVYIGNWNEGPPLPVIVRWSIIAVVLAALMLPVGMVILWLRKLMQRPHPFVEVSS